MAEPLSKEQLKKLMAKFPVKLLETGNYRTCPVRLSYPDIWEPSKGEDGYKSTYGATLLFPLGADLSLLNEAVAKAAHAKFGKDWQDQELKLPFRDQGVKKNKTGYVKGAKFFRATSEQQPGILGPDGKPLTNRSKLYPGCWAIATVRPFAFSNKSNGVSFGLQNIAIIADDEPFGAVRADAAEEFADALEGASEAKAMFDSEDAVHDFG
jgi:hypothetical protein